MRERLPAIRRMEAFWPGYWHGTIVNQLLNKQAKLVDEHCQRLLSRLLYVSANRSRNNYFNNRIAMGYL
jgi:hypothetical protein